MPYRFKLVVRCRFLKNLFINLRSGPKEGTRMTLNDTTSLADSDFKPSRKTKFITHGWKSSAMSTGFLNMKDGTLIFFDLLVRS